MLSFRIISIKRMFGLFLWFTLIVIVVSSIFAFTLLYKNINHAKKSAIDSVFYSTESMITEHMDAITDLETILHMDRNIQEYLNETNYETAETLKVNAAGVIQSTVNVKGQGLGAVLFSENETASVLKCNANQEEELYINELYHRFRENANSSLFIYELENSLYPEFYICHFKPVTYHSMKTLDSYEVGTMAIFSKINVYELRNTVQKNSVMQVEIQNAGTGESFVLVDTASENQTNGTAQVRRIGYTDWYISAELFELVNVSFFSPFMILSIVLLVILLLYVLLLKKSVRVLVDTPVRKISTYLEEFMLSQSRRTVLKTVEIEEFDDILKYINELFERVTDQARLVVKTQQEMYEEQLQANEQTLYMNQLQINPHFLFNTLNTITQMCLAEGLNDVTEITHSIAEIFRYSTEGDYKATIDEEIYIVLKYLKIFNSRYGREFTCELDIEDDLYELQMMKMILQPLIENSFKHGGIANVKDPLIKISAHRNQDEIIISVFDNGNGILEEKLKQINLNLAIGKTKENKGIGLLNVNKRLKICYGEQSGLEVESEYGKYTKIIIRIKDEKQS